MTTFANQSGAAFRSDCEQWPGCHSAKRRSTAQPTTYAYQWWANTTTGLLKLRNGSNSAWIVVGTLADTNLGLLSLAGGTLTGALLADDSGTAALPAIAFDGDPNTGIFRAGADQFGIATNGVERVEFGTTEVVFNDGGADVDFRIEGDTEPNLFKIDAGLDEVQVANLNGGPLAGFRNRIINGAQVRAIGTTKVSIGTSWQKVTVTATVPSISGKTLGTNGDSYLALTFWFDAGSDFNARTDSLGQQSGTFEIAQVQLEPGAVATPFEQRPIGTELALCQRYFEAGSTVNCNNASSGGTQPAGSIFYSPKRELPYIVTCKSCKCQLLT
jgi:hypothetical protein